MKSGTWYLSPNCVSANDATACLQAAIQQVKDGGGGVLQLPADAMVRIRGTITLYAGVVMDGTTGVVNIADHSVDTRATIYTPSNVNLAGPLVRVSGSYAGVRDLILSRTFWDGDYDGSMLEIGKGSTHFVMNRCTLWGARVSKGVLIDEQSVNNVEITNSRINGPQFGILTNTAGYKTATGARDWTAVGSWGSHAHHLRIENNEIFHRGDGININSPVWNGLRPEPRCLYGVQHPGNNPNLASGNPNVGDHDIVIRNNHIRGSYPDDESKVGTRGFCVALAGAKHVIVEGNTLENCRWNAVHLEDRCYNVLIVENYMNTVGGPSSSMTSSIWANNVRGVAIVGNVMRRPLNGNGLTMVGNSPRKWYCHETEQRYNRLFRISGNQVIEPGDWGYSFAGTGLNNNGMATCFGWMGANGACAEPTWHPLWSDNFGGSYYPKNTCTAGPSSNDCIVHTGTLGLTMGWAETQMCR
jgi:hypothetical protein